jgi:hypothetical protein
LLQSLASVEPDILSDADPHQKSEAPLIASPDGEAGDQQHIDSSCPMSTDSNNVELAALQEVDRGPSKHDPHKGAACGNDDDWDDWDEEPDGDVKNPIQSQSGTIRRENEVVKQYLVDTESSTRIGDEKTCTIPLGSLCIGGTTQRRAATHLRCTKCSFKVVRLLDVRWTQSADYLWFRNFAPDAEKLRERTELALGFAAYACQCSWQSIRGLKALVEWGTAAAPEGGTGDGTGELKWCRGFHPD